jgi:hypothetical protein
MTRRNQQGSVLTLVMLGILATGVLATIAYGSYYQIARGTQDTMNRANSSALLTQGAYTLATEAAALGDIDTDGVTEPPGGLIPLSDGYEIPTNSGASKNDAWGSKILYCPWDSGSTNTSTGRLNGASPGDQNSLQFALISAGPDKTLDTTCANVLAHVTTHAPVITNGDDGVRTMTVAQLNQGVGGTYYYGDPVADVLKLPSNAPTGMMRVTKDTQIPYFWNGTSWLPLNAGAWLVIAATTTAATTPCTPYPPGTLARDSADVLYMCKANGTWRTVP